MDFASLTAKGQVSIPKAVLEVEAFGMKRGELLNWELEKESVRLKVWLAVNQAYLRGMQAGLTEWGSDADEEAFVDL